ncbi:MAG: GAF domain-containing protein, partial [Thermoguttaceae bacterium]
MTKPAPPRLKLYTERNEKIVRPPIEAIASLPELLRAFRTLTGWSLRYISGAESKPAANDQTWVAEIQPGKDSPTCFLCLQPAVAEQTTEESAPRLDFKSAREMAFAVAHVIEELQKTRYMLWQREADLAAGVPMTPLADEKTHLAERLQTTLKGVTEAIDCQAAALYLLDEATTELKLRSCWGLPFERLMAAPRPLQGQLADLEALLGHAVVLENTTLMHGWKVPENFAAAVCVPVSSPTMLLGTLWLFGDEVRDFTDKQIHIIEIVAGKLAAELEREVLLHE